MVDNAVAVGILFIISIALLTRKKKQAFRDDAFLTLGGTLLVLGIIFGDDRLGDTHSLG